MTSLTEHPVWAILVSLSNKKAHPRKCKNVVPSKASISTSRWPLSFVTWPVPLSLSWGIIGSSLLFRISISNFPNCLRAYTAWLWHLSVFLSHLCWWDGACLPSNFISSKLSCLSSWLKDLTILFFPWNTSPSIRTKVSCMSPLAVGKPKTAPVSLSLYSCPQPLYARNRRLREVGRQGEQFLAEERFSWTTEGHGPDQHQWRGQ